MKIDYKSYVVSALNFMAMDIFVWNIIPTVYPCSSYLKNRLITLSLSTKLDILVCKNDLITNKIILQLAKATPLSHLRVIYNYYFDWYSIT